MYWSVHQYTYSQYTREIFHFDQTLILCIIFTEPYSYDDRRRVSHWMRKLFTWMLTSFFLMQLLQLKQLLFFWSQVCSQSENLLMYSGYYLTLFKCRWVSSVYWLSVLKRKFWLNMIVLGRRSSDARHGLCPFGGWSTGEEDPCRRSPPLSRAAACKWL